MVWVSSVGGEVLGKALEAIEDEVRMRAGHGDAEHSLQQLRLCGNSCLNSWRT